MRMYGDLTFYRRWILANGWAELLGLGGTLLLGWLGFKLFSSVGETPAVILLSALIAIMLGALLEGTLVGVAQAGVLKANIPGFPVRRWIWATTVGAGIAWLLGMLPSTVIGLLHRPGSTAVPPAGPGPALQIVLAVVMGAVLGPVLAIPQGQVLRAFRPGVRGDGVLFRWIVANMAAWSVGLPVIFIGLGSIPLNAGVLRVGLTVVATCFATGIVVGAIHGPVMQRLLAGSPVTPQPG